MKQRPTSASNRPFSWVVRSRPFSPARSRVGCPQCKHGACQEGYRSGAPSICQRRRIEAYFVHAHPDQGWTGKPRSMHDKKGGGKSVRDSRVVSETCGERSFTFRQVENVAKLLTAVQKYIQCSHTMGIQWLPCCVWGRTKRYKQSNE